MASDHSGEIHKQSFDGSLGEPVTAGELLGFFGPESGNTQDLDCDTEGIDTHRADGEIVDAEVIGSDDPSDIGAALSAELVIAGYSTGDHGIEPTEKTDGDLTSELNQPVDFNPVPPEALDEINIALDEFQVTYGDHSPITNPEGDGQVDGVPASSDSRPFTIVSSYGELVPGSPITTGETGVIERSLTPEEIKRQDTIEQGEYRRRIKARTESLKEAHFEVQALAQLIGEALVQRVVFTQADIDLGVGAIATYLLLDRTTKIDHGQESRPETLLQSDESIIERTVDSEERKFIIDVAAEAGIEIGDEAEDKILLDVITAVILDDKYAGDGKKLLAKAFLDGRLPMSEAVRENLLNLLSERRPKKRLRKEPTLEEVLAEASSDEAWALVEQAFFDRANWQVAESHKEFFDAFNRPHGELSGEEILSRAMTIDGWESGISSPQREIMQQDIKTLAHVAHWEPGVDYEIVGEGEKTSYMLAPIRKNPGDIDAINKFKVYAGENIASIGSNSFMGLVDANTDQANGVDGALLVLAHSPQMPVHAVEKKSRRVGLDGKLIESNGEGDEDDEFATSNIRWSLRVWHLTPKGHSMMLTRMQALKDDPETIFAPFINPRDTIEEMFPLMDAIFRVRSATAQNKATARNISNIIYKENERRAANGQNVDNNKFAELMQLTQDLPKTAERSEILRMVSGLNLDAEQIRRATELLISQTEDYLESMNNLPAPTGNALAHGDHTHSTVVPTVVPTR